MEEQFQRHEHEELDGKMHALRGLLRGAASYEAIENLREPLRSALLAGHPHSAIVVVRADGTSVLTVGQSEVVRRLMAGYESADSHPARLEVDDRDYRVAEESVPLAVPGAGPVRVMITFDITENLEFIREFNDALWIVVLGGSVIAGELGWLLVRRGLAPLRRLSNRLASVSSEALNRPIAIDDIPADLRELIVSFNRMMLRLNESFQRLSEFSSDIAHELRTPINNMMLQAQVVLAQRRDVEDYCGYLQSNLEELRRLSQMVENMLFLAKADNRLLAPRLEEIDLQVEIEKVVDYFEIAANEQGVRIVRTGHARSIVGDRLMVQRALSNVLSNALRFTPRGEAISVDAFEQTDSTRVCVANLGPDVPPDQMSKVFERFYRADSSRREGQTLNVGLGLAITKSIMEIHGGSVAGESANGLTRFTLEFPRNIPLGASRHHDGQCACSARQSIAA